LFGSSVGFSGSSLRSTNFLVQSQVLIEAERVSQTDSASLGHYFCFLEQQRTT
jgi:hypothetical protein